MSLLASLMLLQEWSVPRLEKQILINREVNAEIQQSTPPTTSPWLEKTLARVPVRAIHFEFRPRQDGVYFVDMRSNDFDTYLILREENHSVIAEDDDGWMESQSRIFTRLKKGQTYILSASALHSGIGKFEICVRRGDPPDPTPSELRKWAHDDRSKASAQRIEGANILTLGEDRAQDAQRLFENALQASLKALGENHIDTASCLFELGRVLGIQGKLSDAIPILRRAIQIQERRLGSKDIATCESYYVLGDVLFRSGQHLNGITAFESALPGFRDWLDADESRIGLDIKFKAAEISCRLGYWTAAETLYRRCLDISRRKGKGENLNTAHFLSMIGWCLSVNGNVSEARVFWENSLEVHRKLATEKSLFFLSTQYRIAKALLEQGSLADAERLIQSTIENCRTFPGNGQSLLAQARATQGYIHLKRNRYAEAWAAYDESLALNKKLRNPGFVIAKDLLGLALVAIAQLNLAEADRLLDLAENENRGDQEWAQKVRELQILVIKSRVRALNGDYDGATKHLKHVIEITNSFPGASDRSRIQIDHDLTSLYMESNNPIEAWNSALRYFETTKRNCIKSLWAISERERYEFVGNFRSALDFVLDLAIQSGSNVELETAFNALVSWKAQVFVGLLSTKQLMFQASSSELHSSLQQLRGIQSELSSLMSSPKNEGWTGDTTLETLLQLRWELERSIERQFKPDTGGQHDWKSIQKNLPLDSCFVSFIEHRRYIKAERKDGRVIKSAGWGPHQVSAFILTSELRSPELIQIGDSIEISQIIREFLTEVISERPSLLGNTNSRSLALNNKLLEKIWVPIQKHLGKSRLILISADSSIGTFPFGIIRTNDGQHLLEKYRFAFLQDVSSLFHFSDEPPKKSSDILIVGGVDFEKQESTDIANSNHLSSLERSVWTNQEKIQWPPLPGTIEEAKSIAELHKRMFPKHRQLLLQKQSPSERRIKKELSGYDYVHLASHGFSKTEGVRSYWDEIREVDFSTSNTLENNWERFKGQLPGLLSGIVCAGSNQETRPKEENGILTAEEIAWLNLSQCDLVVLSACQTALGTIQAGEGIIGLRSAFRQAGAKTVISSLWSIGDQSTKTLMEYFYSALWIENKGKLEALQSAQVRMIEDQRKQFQGKTFPYAWGAFVLDGNWN